jgi:class 3 adenylate cyclase
MAVNLAARVMSVAGPREIVATAAAGAMVGQHVACESLGAREFKGVPGAWEVFRIDTPIGTPNS